jgi:hypothetical protein
MRQRFPLKKMSKFRNWLQAKERRGVIEVISKSRQVSVQKIIQNSMEDEYENQANKFVRDRAFDEYANRQLRPGTNGGAGTDRGASYQSTRSHGGPGNGSPQTPRS